MSEIHFDDVCYEGTLTGAKLRQLQKWFFKPGTCWKDESCKRGKKLMIQRVDFDDRKVFVRWITGVLKGHGEHISFSVFMKRFRRIKTVWGKNVGGKEFGA